jgi:hypothetical protein
MTETTDGYTPEEIEKFKKNSDRYEWLRSPRRSHRVVGRIVDNMGKREKLCEYALDRVVDEELLKTHEHRLECEPAHVRLLTHIRHCLTEANELMLDSAGVSGEVTAFVFVAQFQTSYMLMRNQAIVAEVKAGVGYKEIALRYGITMGRVSQIYKASQGTDKLPD